MEIYNSISFLGFCGYLSLIRSEMVFSQYLQIALCFHPKMMLNVYTELQVKMENFSCVLAVHLHACSWKWSNMKNTQIRNTKIENGV